MLLHVLQELGRLQVKLFLSILKYSTLVHVLREIGKDHHSSLTHCHEPTSKCLICVRELQLLGSVHTILLLLREKYSMSVHVDRFVGSVKSVNHHAVRILKCLILVQFVILEGKGQVIQCLSVSKCSKFTRLHHSDGIVPWAILPKKFFQIWNITRVVISHTSGASVQFQDLGWKVDWLKSIPVTLLLISRVSQFRFAKLVSSNRHSRHMVLVSVHLKSSIKCESASQCTNEIGLVQGVVQLALYVSQKVWWAGFDAAACTSTLIATSDIARVPIKTLLFKKFVADRFIDMK